uniref:SMARCC C-terminal domain-containing protein n=1 Tax=Globisporangium ultimum (strain ATCC 200006 / CBS 805.95 / DAOM BR144) TaxID=431595 RepID=K3X196_GLOUD
MHAMLDQAIAELQFLKKREERSLQSQIKQIEESFTLRLEIFEQQYLTKVEEIKQEMQAAIEQQKRKCETTILTAAKQLKQKTQQPAVVPDLPAPILEGQQKEVDEHGAETQRELSPVSAQKAKLRVLETKLASFSQESVDRVSSELKSGRRKAQISNGTQARA